MDAEDRSRENLRELASLVSTELDLYKTFRAAVENRAIAVFALNLGLVTLYLALRDQLGLMRLEPGDLRHCLVVIGLVAAALSLAASVVVVWPGFHSRFLPTDLRVAYNWSFDESTDLLSNLMELRIDQLEAYADTVTRKNAWLIVGLALAALAMISLGCSIAGQLLFA